MDDINKKHSTEYECLDALIWIGQSYFKFLCTSTRSCAIPFRSRKHCYVHEAELRGCCRKIPFSPKWVVPGRSRVFLAHKDGLTSPHLGKIFGYYEVAQVQHVKPPRQLSTFISREVALRKRGDKSINLLVKLLRPDHGTIIDRAEVMAISKKEKNKYRGSSRGNGEYEFDIPPGFYDILIDAPGYQQKQVKGIEIKPKRKVVQDIYLDFKTPEENECLTMTCNNGKDVTTHIYEKGHWETKESYPDLSNLPSRCREGAVITAKCWDGSTITIAKCEGGEWQLQREKCPDFPDPNGNDGDDDPNNNPIDYTFFEEDRSCSLRIKPRSTYLIDALAKKISLEFNNLMRSKTIIEDFLSAKSNIERDTITKEGRAMFNDLVAKIVKSYRPVTEVPNILEPLIEMRGELVMLKKPVILTRKPKAAFRGLIRIRGDLLIEQIVNGVKYINTPYC